MGYRLHFPGVCPQLLRALGCSVLPRSYGRCHPAGTSIPRIQSKQADMIGIYNISLDLLLQSGIGKTGRHILLRDFPRRRLFRSTRCGDTKHGRERWKGGMGLDLHPVRDIRCSLPGSANVWGGDRDGDHRICDLLHPSA
jgi:hypothetical protein